MNFFTNSTPQNKYNMNPVNTSPNKIMKNIDIVIQQIYKNLLKTPKSKYFK